MRSIYIHFPTDDERAVRTWLDEHTHAQSDNSWTYPAVGEVRLWISLSAIAQLDDWEPTHVPAVADVVGVPAGLVTIDVSGRVPGDEEVSEVTLSLLEISPGARAQDDYTTHLWKIDEIRAMAKAEGHPFFDYLGWYAADKSAG